MASPRLLDPYRAKRSPGKTPEPFGDDVRGDAERADAPLAFVVQQHAARSMHFDLRLEWGGVLLSWAVPKGPSRNPADKQLAVQTEDHPLEYASFEGVIPKGEYGGGAMIVWDRGRMVPQLDMDEGLIKGKLLFELQGFKLRGVWTLVRIKKDPRSWLLIKERDAWASATPEPWDPASVLSGLTVEELGEGRSRGQAVRAALEAQKAPRRSLRAEDVQVMLAEPRREAFSKPGWLFELKYDGYRLLAAKRAATRGAGRVLLRTRGGQDATRTFPEVARALQALPYEELLLDGEAVVLDRSGRANFGLLQKRGQLRQPADVERAVLELPVVFFAFDLLSFEGTDARQLPLTTRKELLRQLMPRSGCLRFADHVEERGLELFCEARRLGVEGIMAKRADGAYVGGRSAQWLKIRADLEDDFVIVGYTLAKGSRSGFGAIHLAQWLAVPGHKAKLVYTGRAGSGFTDVQLRALRKELEPLRRKTPPFSGAGPEGRDHVWVEPQRVASARFTERTADGLLRHPVFLRLRDDKRPEECLVQEAAGELEVAAKSDPLEAKPAPQPKRTAGKAAASAPRAVKFSNLDKVFWLEEGYTKGDLIAFYRDIAPWLLPYLHDRPLVLTRFPDGIAGKSFFQKNAPAGTPEWIRTLPIWSDDSERDIEYFICNDVETLVHLANLGTIPLHVWASRVSDLEHPDWCILDLDPKGAPFTDVVQIARAARVLCEEAGLPAYAKTSGSQGMHVLIPLGRQCSFEQTKQLAMILASMLARQLPKISTVERSIPARRGRVYIDALQNGEGKLLVAPFSVRPVPGARVSTPLFWKEVTPRLDATRFTLRTVVARMEKLGDPLAPVLTERPDLPAALRVLLTRADFPGQADRD
ncbi:MAG: DNA ligase D [Acidobacteriota bacterium]